MKTMLTYQGGSVRQSKINDGKLVMKNQFYDDPSYRDSFVIWEHGKTLDELIEIPIKIFNEKYSSAAGFSIQFNTLIDDMLPLGAVLYDIKKKIYYLCTESYDRDEILSAGKLTRCNSWLRWQDIDGNIFDYPVFDINSTQYNSGVSGDKTMTLGSTQHMITITADENTIALDHDKRFFMDRNTINPTAFKLTQNDTTAMNYDKGLLKITVTEDAYNAEVDSIENWLCGYVEPKPDIPTTAIEITYSGSGQPQIRSGGANKVFTAQTDNPVTWSIEVSAEQKDYVILSQTDADIAANKCRVKCLSNEDLVLSKFKLKCTDGVNSGEVEITIAGGI